MKGGRRELKGGRNPKEQEENERWSFGAAVVAFVPLAIFATVAVVCLLWTVLIYESPYQRTFIPLDEPARPSKDAPKSGR